MSVRLGFRSAKFPRGALLGALVVVWALLVGACGQRVEVGIDDALTTGATTTGGASAGNGGSAASAGTAGATSGQGGASDCVETKCRDQLYQCGNCGDDDDDGSIDALDPECLGPCDDDESGLSTGMDVMMTANCRQDCYFDGNAGPGNDQCVWSHACDRNSVAPDYPPSGDMRCEYDATTTVMGKDCAALEAEQAPQCREACFPLVPNGCDCFGCCELTDGQYHFVGQGKGEPGCQLGQEDDLVACPLCAPVESCLNRCEDCEACVGKGPRLGCSPGSACPPGQAACFGTNEPCDFGEYCVTGCCVRAPEPI